MAFARVIVGGISVAVLGTAGCADPPELTPKPCFAKHVVIDVDTVTALDFTPRDAIDDYSATFVGDDGMRRTIDVSLFKPIAAWERVIVREPAFGYEETPACDPRVGVELEVEFHSDDGLFAERFHGAAVRTAFQDAWLTRMVRPLDAIAGEYPTERPDDACPDVDVGFSLLLEAGEAGGAITEGQPNVAHDDDPCYREVLSWEL